MPAISPTIDLRDWGLLFLLSVIWGGSYLFIGIAVQELSPLVIVMARVIIAALALLPVLLIFGEGFPRGRDIWIGIAGMSVLNNIIPFLLIVSGQTMIASGLASVINATTPLFGVIFIALAGVERLVAFKMIGIAIGITGVAILKGGTLLDSGNQSLGILLCLGAAASYGLGGLWARIRLRGTAPLSMATGQLLVSSAVMIVLAFAFDHPMTLLQASGRTWAALLGLALLATSFAYIIFFRVVARSGAANVLLVTMMIPPSAIVMGYMVLGERLEWREIIGALIIIAALVIIDGRVLKRLRFGNQTT
jgi:drug/metabolite transporter (DMT)-like permease